VVDKALHPDRPIVSHERPLRDGHFGTTSARSWPASASGGRHRRPPTRRDPMLTVANVWYRGANKSLPQRRYPGNASNPALRNCNLLACICVLFSTDRRGAGKTYAANAEELVEQTSL
jgi:hypothetical protein